MNVDLIRTVWTMLIATIIVVGGMIFLFVAMDRALEHPDAKPDQLILGAIIAMMTGASSYVFGEQIAARASARTARATQAGVEAALTTPPGS